MTPEVEPREPSRTGTELLFEKYPWLLVIMAYRDTSQIVGREALLTFEALDFRQSETTAFFVLNEDGQEVIEPKKGTWRKRYDRPWWDPRRYFGEFILPESVREVLRRLEHEDAPLFVLTVSEDESEEQAPTSITLYGSPEGVTLLEWVHALETKRVQAFFDSMPLRTSIGMGPTEL